MNKFGLLCGALLLSGASSVFGQGAKNIVINEVMTNNTASIQDEFGKHEAWIELENTSFTTYNIRGMYLTTDRSVLDQNMSVPERIKRMSIIPSGDARTSLGGRQQFQPRTGETASDSQTSDVGASMDCTLQRKCR